MDDENNINDPEELFNQMPKNVRIIPFRVSPQLMMEFQQQIQEMNGRPILEDLLEQDFMEIADEKTFKDTLVQAAFIGSVEGFRKLEALEAVIEDGASRKDWARLATLYARMIMEQDLLDDPISFIVSGLGGEDNRIRYCFVLLSDQLITESLARLVASEYEELAPFYDMTWEDSLYFTDRYIRFTMLVPYQNSPSEMIQAGLDKLTFLDKEYMESNMVIPEEEEVDQWLSQRKKNK